MKEPLPLNELPDEQRVAYFGALFAMAAADDTVDKEEAGLILETLDTEGLAEVARRRIRSYVVEPPLMDEVLSGMGEAPEEVRYGLMLQLVEVALANDLIEESERQRLVEAQRALGVSDEQLAAMHGFAEEAKRIRERGIDDAYAADTLKAAAAGLTATGVPIAAIIYSGSVVGLSAAGITSGLAALGLGLGMVGGIGVVIIIGAGIYIGITRLLDVGGKRKKARLQRERERKAQLAIQNLQDMIAHLVDQVTELQEGAADAAANKEAIQKLNDRLRAMKQLLENRKKALAHAA